MSREWLQQQSVENRAHNIKQIAEPCVVAATLGARDPGFNSGKCRFQKAAIF